MMGNELYVSLCGTIWENTLSSLAWKTSWNNQWPVLRDTSDYALISVLEGNIQKRSVSWVEERPILITIGRGKVIVMSYCAEVDIGVLPVENPLSTQNAHLLSGKLKAGFLLITWLSRVPSALKCVLWWGFSNFSPPFNHWRLLTQPPQGFLNQK